MADIHVQQTGPGFFDFAVTVTPEASPGGGQVTVAEAHVEDREAGG
jgi:hypothetical protein